MTRRDRILLAVSRGEDVPDTDRRWLRDEIQRKQQSARRVAARSLPRRRARDGKRLSRNERMAQIAEAVKSRSKYQCEAWVPGLSASENLRGTRCMNGASVFDHWEGGNGRRRQRESATTCWHLCHRHNEERTANHPGAWWWNMSRELFCRAHGIPFTPHIEHTPRASRVGEAR